MARDTGKLLQRALDDATTARNDLRKARGDVRRYRGKAAKTRARNRVATAQKKIERAVVRVDKYASVAAAEEARSPVSRGESAQEWEIGFSYEGNRRAGNSVSVNFRLFKRSGKLVEKSEAAAAVRELHRGGRLSDLPFGLHVEAVDWKRPGWRGSREGKPGDLMAFSSIMQTVFLDDFRVSPVAEDN